MRVFVREIEKLICNGEKATDKEKDENKIVLLP